MLNIRNRHLKAVYDIYNERMKEAKEYLVFMQKISHCNVIMADNNTIDLSSLKYIINSSLSLILYNIIENATTGMIDSIHQDLKDNNIKHHELNSALYRKFLMQIQKMGKKEIENLSNNYSANNTINDQMVFLEHDNQNIFNGNVDCQKIKEISKQYGFGIAPNGSNHWLTGDILYIKSKRNELAHGAISFVDYGKNVHTQGNGTYKFSVGRGDIEAHNNIEHKLESVEKWLDCLFENIDDYLANQKYKN